MTYTKLLKDIYSTSNENLSVAILKSDTYELNCFIKSEKVGSYPPRISFVHKWHNIQQDNKDILKQNSKALFCFNDEVMYISDIFLDKKYQSIGIVKSIITSSIYNLKKDYPSIQHITLKSLASGILPWYKIGFCFYQIKDKIRVEEILEDYLIDIKNIDEDDVEQLLNLKTIGINYLKDTKIDFDNYLQKHGINMVPMHIKVKK